MGDENSLRGELTLGKFHTVSAMQIKMLFLMLGGYVVLEWKRCCVTIFRRQESKFYTKGFGLQNNKITKHCAK